MRQRFDNIQILRVLSCLGVFASHLAPKMGLTGTPAKIANFGASGVYMFFLISAFLACGGAKDRPFRVLPYYVRRAFRILPLYYAVILYAFLLHTLILRDVPADPAGLSWLRYLFLTNAVLPAANNFWSNLFATWTISLFLVFYLLVPLLRKVRGIVSAGILYLLALVLKHQWMIGPWPDYMMCIYYFHFFALGILVRELVEKKQPVKVTVGFLAFAALLYTGVFGLVETDYFTVLSWIFALVVLASQKFSWKKAEESKAFGRAAGGLKRLFAVLDEHAYALYLVHAVIVEGMEMVAAHVTVGPALMAVSVIGLTAVGTILAHRLIEKPCTALGQRCIMKL